VDALAAVLAANIGHGGQGSFAGAAEPVQARARNLFEQRIGNVGWDSPTAKVRASVSGVPEAVAVAVMKEPQTAADVIELGRALSWLEKEWGHQQ
jgi:hypothetical protein